jgi:rsbT co-antagonist protein RsbR
MFTMVASPSSLLAALVAKHEARLLDTWVESQAADGSLRSGRIKPEELRDQSSRFLREFVPALQSGQLNDITGVKPWSARERDTSPRKSRVDCQASPTETALFVFSMKQPLFALLQTEVKDSAKQLGEELSTITRLLDKLGLYTSEVYQQSRDAIVKRQAQELLELSTPVVELWDRIVALPLIGTLDSERTQTVMENLLNHIVKSGAEIAIIDITGVPTVDTLVAQHLIKTVSAARLMGADCIISGIRPQIAQTIVHLGLQLDVVSKATMADAFALALRRTGQSISRTAKSA